MRIFQIQRITAVAMLVFMTIHMVVVHYPPFHIDFSIIAQRMASPIWKAIEVLFLGTVLLHGLAGAYVVLTDYRQVNRFKKIVAGAIIVIGIAAFLWGAFTVLSWQVPA
jgi:succinate dehydrogenase hydrophobic membrane anchor protein